MGDPPSDERRPSRWWALGLLVPMAALVASAQSAPQSVHLRLAVAGTPERWAQQLAAAPVSLDDVRVALLLDIVFAASFAVIGFVLMRTGLRHWAPERRRRFGGWHLLPMAAVVAAVLDVVETAGQLVWLHDPSPPSAATHLIASITWWEWVVDAVSIVGLLGLVIGPAIAPVVRPILRGAFGAIDRQLGEEPAAAPATGSVRPSGALGICASGGGIRSASVMLGAFRALSDDGTFGRARWLHAVSGGGYSAGGWRVSSSRRDEIDLFDNRHPWFCSVRQRRRYLDNGWGSLVGGILGAMVRTIAVLGGVLAVAVLFGWTTGWFVRSWALHHEFSNAAGGGATTWSALTERRLVLPGAIPIAAALVLAVIARTRADEAFRRRLDAPAAALGVLGAVLVALLVAAPVGIRYGRPILASLVGRTAEVNAGLLGLLSALGMITAVGKLLTSELKKRWSRLGGVALAFGLLLLAGKVADDRANIDRFFAPVWVPILAITWLVLLDIPPAHRLTLNGVYRKRLATTFCLGAGSEVPLPPVPFAEEPVWSEYLGAAGPELVLCATSHATRRQLGGIRALGFTFRPAGVTLHDGVSAPWRTYPAGSWWDGYPQRWVVSRSMALTGAAFASAMGRQSFGTTNSLLAAVNLRLGMWVPNPRFPEWFVDGDSAPRVHLGYFAKELLNRYHPDRDPFVYVADGGHRDNLGLVEQLREQPSTSIVLDASGDHPGSFTTLRQAIELAGVELGVEVDVDFSSVDQRPGDEPIDCVASGTITYADGTTGRLVYAKAQISDTAPVELRQFAAANPPFPDYSTGDQYLSEIEFDMLVALGEHLGRRVAVVLSE